MTSKTALEVSKQLADKVHGINSAQAPIFLQSGTSNKEAQLLAIRKFSAELVHALGSRRPHDKVAKAYKDVAAATDAAVIIGLISEEELTDYNKLMDDLWMAIEKENK